MSKRLRGTFLLRISQGGAIAGCFVWWVGVLRRTESPKWDVWHCGHQHGSAEDARSCVDELLYALNGSAEPLRLRND